MKHRILLSVAAFAMVLVAGCSPKVVLVKVQDTGEVKPGVFEVWHTYCDGSW